MKNRKSTKQAVNVVNEGYSHVWIARPKTKGYTLIAAGTRDGIRTQRNINGASHYSTPEKIVIID